MDKDLEAQMAQERAGRAATQTESINKCDCPRTYGGEFLRHGHRTGCSGGSRG